MREARCRPTRGRRARPTSKVLSCPSWNEVWTQRFLEPDYPAFLFQNLEPASPNTASPQPCMEPPAEVAPCVSRSVLSWTAGAQRLGPQGPPGDLREPHPGNPSGPRSPFGFPGTPGYPQGFPGTLGTPQGHPGNPKETQGPQGAFKGTHGAESKKIYARPEKHLNVVFRVVKRGFA